MSKLLIIIGFLTLTSCISLKKQFIKKPVESAELCKLYFPTKEKKIKVKLTRINKVNPEVLIGILLFY